MMKQLDKSFNDGNNILATSLLLLYNGTMEFCCGPLGWELIMVQTEQSWRVLFICDEANMAF